MDDSDDLEPRGQCSDCQRNINQDENVAHDNVMICLDCLSKHPKKYSGFSKPMEISNALARLLKSYHPDIYLGDLVSRTSVTKYLNGYIIAHGLKNPDDSRIIEYKKDAEFEKILNMDGIKGDLTYFSLQKAIKHNFLA